MFTLSVIEPQPIAIEGLRRLSETTREFTVIGAWADPAEALQSLAIECPALLLLGHGDALRAVTTFIARVRQTCPGLPAVLWGADFSDMERLKAGQAGVRGIIKKTAPLLTLLECLQTVARGDLWMEDGPTSVNGSFRGLTRRITPRENQIVELVCRGLRNREIAAALSISPGTVKVHLMHIFEKTGVKDRFQLALQARHLLPVPTPEAT